MMTVGRATPSSLHLTPGPGAGLGAAVRESGGGSPWGVSGIQPFPGSLLGCSLKSQAQRTPRVSGWVGSRLQATPS